MRIVVTGGAGYVGSVLVPQLLERGHLVRVFDAGLYSLDGLHRLVASTKEKHNLQVIQGTLEHLPPGITADADAVIHLAGYSNDPTAECSPERTLEVNVEGTHALLFACEASHVERFVLASSASLYDREGASADVLDETDPIEPQSTYSRSKAICEEMLFKSPIPVPVALRKGTLFGWSPRMRWDLVVNTMTRDALVGNGITVANDGEMWRPLLHVEDAARAYVWAVEAHDLLVRGQVFNVVQDNYLIKHVTTLVQRACGFKRLEPAIMNLPANKARDYRISGDKLTKAGFTPAVTVEDGAVELVEKVFAYSKRALLDPHGENITWLRLMAEMQQLMEAGVRP